MSIARARAGTMRASLIVFPTCSSALLQYPLSLIVVCCMLQRASRVSAHVQAAQPPNDSRPAAKGGGVATSPASKVSRRQATPPRLAPPRRCWVRSPCTDPDAVAYRRTLPARVGRGPARFRGSRGLGGLGGLGGLRGLVARRAVGEEGVAGDGGSGDNGGRAGLGHRLVAAWARVRAAFGDG